TKRSLERAWGASVEKSVGNREIASNRVQKKYHRSLTPLAWLEASGGTALSMGPDGGGYGFKQSGISISSEPLCNLPVRHGRGFGGMDTTRRQNPRKLSSAGA